MLKHGKNVTLLASAEADLVMRQPESFKSGMLLRLSCLCSYSVFTFYTNSSMLCTGLPNAVVQMH